MTQGMAPRGFEPARARARGWEAHLGMCGPAVVPRWSRGRCAESRRTFRALRETLQDRGTDSPPAPTDAVAGEEGGARTALELR